MIVVQRHTAANRITFDKSQVGFDYIRIRINSGIQLEDDLLVGWRTIRISYLSTICQAPLVVFASLMSRSSTIGLLVDTACSN